MNTGCFMVSVGLFFGSFNPVHNGHLSIARYLLDEGHCGQVWFVVSPLNPWKTDVTLLDEKKRLELVSEAIRGEKRMKASDVEFFMPRPSYTYQTLQVLKTDYPEEKFALIMGEDNLLHFHEWKNYRQIISEYPVFVYPRPGNTFINPLEAGVKVVDAPMTGISSTEIREKIRKGENISEFVPQGIVGKTEKYYRDLLC